MSSSLLAHSSSLIMPAAVILLRHTLKEGEAERWKHDEEEFRERKPFLSGLSLVSQ